MKKELIDILKDSAWYEGRKKDIDYVYDDLKKLGLSKPNEIVHQFIEEFENVVLEYQTPNGIFLKVHFSVEKGIDNTSVELQSDFEKTFGENLVPVGCFGENIGVIEMSYSGKFLLIVPEDGMFLLGDNFESTIETIIFQKPLNKLGDVPGW